MAWTRRTVNSRILCPGLPLPLTLWPMAEKASQRVLLPPSLAEKSRPLWKAAFEEPFPPRAQTYSESVLPGRLQQLDHFHGGAQLCDGGQCVRDVLTVLVAIAIELGETQGRSLGHRVEAGRDRERSNHQMPHPPPSRPSLCLCFSSSQWRMVFPGKSGLCSQSHSFFWFGRSSVPHLLLLREMGRLGHHVYQAVC